MVCRMLCGIAFTDKEAIVRCVLRIEDSNDKEKIHVKNCVVVTKPDEIMKEVTCFGAGYLNHPRQRGFQLHRPRPLTRKGMLKLTRAVYFFRLSKRLNKFVVCYVQDGLSELITKKSRLVKEKRNLQSRTTVLIFIFFCC